MLAWWIEVVVLRPMMWWRILLLSKQNPTLKMTVIPAKSKFILDTSSSVSNHIEQLILEVKESDIRVATSI